MESILQAHPVLPCARMGQPHADLADASAQAICLSPVPAGAPFPCVVNVLGVGDAPPPLLVELRLPPGVLHVGHDPAGRFDADARTLTFAVATRPGAPRAFYYELIADTLATGWTATIDATLRIDDPRERFEARSEASVTVARQSSLDLGYAVLPIAPIWVFLAMVLSMPSWLGLVWVLRRRRRALARAPRRPGQSPVARDTVMVPAFFCLVCVLALLILSPGLVESVRSQTVFTESRCTILDRTQSGSPAPDEGPPTSTAVVRYASPAGPRVAIGFDLRGSMGLGDNRMAYQAFAVGRVYPCWIDPKRPERVVLRRGWSGAAVLALLPAVALLSQLLALWRAWRS